MKWMRSITLCVLAIWMAGCHDKAPPYGVEDQTYFPGKQRQLWAVAPAVNLSGQEVDPLLQADDLYEQLQRVHGLTVIPVNRVAQVFSGLQIARVQSAEQAALICDQLGCDGLIVPTITIYDPYDPPKFGASLQLFRKGQNGVMIPNVDVHELSRAATPGRDQPMPIPQLAGFKQTVGMFDASDGSVREHLAQYAGGRNDPAGPLGSREYLLNMDRYCGFVYHELTVELMRSIQK